MRNATQFTRTKGPRESQNFTKNGEFPLFFDSNYVIVVVTHEPSSVTVFKKWFPQTLN